MLTRQRHCLRRTRVNPITSPCVAKGLIPELPAVASFSASVYNSHMVQTQISSPPATLVRARPLTPESSGGYLNRVSEWLKPILHRVMERESDLSGDEALALAHTSTTDLKGLCRAASILRDRGKGRVVTFSPKVFIPLDPALPGFLRLLHLPTISLRGRHAVHDDGRGAGGGPRRTTAGMHRSAVHSGRAPGAALPRGSRVAQRGGISYHP